MWIRRLTRRIPSPRRRKWQTHKEPTMPYLRPATDTPFGAIPYGAVRSVRPYLKDASAVAIYPGDFVILETDGGVGVVTTGYTTLLRSLHEIDSDTANTTSTLALSIKGLHPIEDGSYATTTGQQRKWVVTVNNHIFGAIGRTGI